MSATLKLILAGVVTAALAVLFGVYGKYVADLQHAKDEDGYREGLINARNDALVEVGKIYAEKIGVLELDLASARDAKASVRLITKYVPMAEPVTEEQIVPKAEIEPVSDTYKLPDAPSYIVLADSQARSIAENAVGFEKCKVQLGLCQKSLEVSQANLADTEAERDAYKKVNRVGVVLSRFGRSWSLPAITCVAGAAGGAPGGAKGTAIGCGVGGSIGLLVMLAEHR